MAEPPNKTASVTVDELLGMAHDAYARARASPDASTKQKLMRLADDYLKQAKDMRRRHVILPAKPVNSLPNAQLRLDQQSTTE